MKTCVKCKRQFPDHLVQPMAVGIDGVLKYHEVCPLCGLDIQNSLGGVRRINFTVGTQTQALLIEARTYLWKLSSGETP